ncbi:hypothetical protein [Streptomyces bicolor]|uniref:hypothetical protein n=1 Tax=Streptomyces bicolor TaxID=66874 RepID=UPI003CC7FD35
MAAVRRYGPAVLLLLTGAAVLRISLFSELYLRYVQRDHDHDHDHSHGNSHSHSHSPKIAWLLTRRSLAGRTLRLTGFVTSDGDGHPPPGLLLRRRRHHRQGRDPGHGRATRRRLGHRHRHLAPRGQARHGRGLAARPGRRVGTADRAADEPVRDAVTLVARVGAAYGHSPARP